MNPTPSVEQTVKQTFARVFNADDWKLFKYMAEFYLQCAVFLTKKDVGYVSPDLKLLARNCLKRLYIGIGTELLLKAIYLKYGFLINSLDKNQPGAPAFPFTVAEVGAFKLLPDKTYMLDKLIDNLQAVPALQGLSGVSQGLKTAKIFRNKEGHGVLLKHCYVPSHYEHIETSIGVLYAKAFGETLQVKFSVGQNQKGVWKKSAP